MWGEWIEMLSPVLFDLPLKSLPVWGEWIEMCSVQIKDHSGIASLPVWGEWIEI